MLQALLMTHRMTAGKQWEGHKWCEPWEDSASDFEPDLGVTKAHALPNVAPVHCS